MTFNYIKDRMMARSILGHRQRDPISVTFPALCSDRLIITMIIIVIIIIIIIIIIIFDNNSEDYWLSQPTPRVLRKLLQMEILSL